MRHRLTPLLLMIGGLLNAHLARAQETGRAGLTMGYPGAVGMIWHVAERVALRPEFSFASSAADTATSGTDATSFGVGVSGLFYVRTWDNLRAYVSPRFVYGRGTTTSKGTATFEGTNSSYATSFSFGSQYAFSRRFGVFGEVGLGYTDLKGSLSSLQPVPSLSITIPTDVRSHSWSTRTGVGIVVYF